MTEAQANIVYDLLVAACGATEDWREDFVRSFAQDECREYRCCGAFGSGGKFYRDSQRWWVSCYREELSAKMVVVNHVLNALRNGAK